MTNIRYGVELFSGFECYECSADEGGTCADEEDTGRVIIIDISISLHCHRNQNRFLHVHVVDKIVVRHIFPKLTVSI